MASPYDNNPGWVNQIHFQFAVISIRLFRKVFIGGISPSTTQGIILKRKPKK